MVKVEFNRDTAGFMAVISMSVLGGIVALSPNAAAILPTIITGIVAVVGNIFLHSSRPVEREVREVVKNE